MATRSLHEHIDVRPGKGFRDETVRVARLIEQLRGVDEAGLARLDKIRHLGRLVEEEHINPAYFQMKEEDEKYRQAMDEISKDGAQPSRFVSQAEVVPEVIRAIRKLLVHGKVHSAVYAQRRFEIPDSVIKEEGISAIAELLSRTYDYESLMKAADVAQSLTQVGILGKGDLNKLRANAAKAMDTLSNKNMFSAVAKIKVAFGFGDTALEELFRV